MFYALYHLPHLQQQITLSTVHFSAVDSKSFSFFSVLFFSFFHLFSYSLGYEWRFWFRQPKKICRYFFQSYSKTKLHQSDWIWIYWKIRTNKNTSDFTKLSRIWMVTKIWNYCWKTCQSDWYQISPSSFWLTNFSFFLALLWQFY